MRGLWQAALLVIATELLTLIFPPVGIIGAAVVALLALRNGAISGINVILLASAALAVLFVAAGVPPAVSFVAGLVQWTPVLLLALVLRVTRCWQVTLQAGLALTLLGAVLLHWLYPDISGLWRSLLERYLQPVLEQAGRHQGDIGAMLDSLASQLTGLLIASLLLSSLLALMLGRQMQAVLYNPGGFRQEFLALRAGLWPAVLGLLLIVWSLAGGPEVLDDLLVVLGAVYFLQGVAVVYALVTARSPMKWSVPVLVLVMVVSLVLLGPLITLLSGLGLADALADFRHRFARPGH